MRTAVLVIATAAALSALTVLGLHWVTAPKAKAMDQGSVLGFVRQDRLAPELSLPNLRGSGMLTLTKLGGKPIVLNFWASTCVNCKQETPALASVARSLGSKITFLGVDSVDLHGQAVAFEAKYKVPYPSMFDPKGVAAARYDVPGLPVTFFLSPSGTKILGENVGALTSKSLRSILHTLYGTT